jgi:2-polyprenyl-3-methyl-5-hydroxy-6-metoxy-1,4-benzoquinol methylase
MDRFLSHDDDLGTLINHSAVELYDRMQKINADELGMPEHCLYYFKTSHTKRLFFSIETSAHLLYRSIRMIEKVPADVVLMDYGAGVGTLFLLAKMIGCKRVIYSDHLEDWRTSAELIAQAINVRIDDFIVGDIDDCLNELEKLNVACDIITSRNVLEHIYKLDKFYAAVHAKQPAAMIFSSTTANIKNPGAVIKHQRWHKKWEKVFEGMRRVAIDRQSPGMTAYKKDKLAAATKGLAVEDLSAAIDEFRKTGKLPDPRRFRTNTCDPSNGVWSENLLRFDEYRRLINEKNFTVSFAPGFWDTHYRAAFKNKLAAMLNKIIAKGGPLAMRLAPFIYVIAKPKKYS